MILFRTDSSLLIGSGHVMRCLTLAFEFSKQGHKCVFACREHEGNLIEFIRKSFPCYILKGDVTANKVDKLNHSGWLGVSQEQDAEELQAIISSFSTDIELLVVDHYALDHRWEKNFAKQVHKLFVIDDLADRLHCCDYLLDQNYYKNIDRYKDLLSTNTVKFLGPSYALLRNEFLESRPTVLQQETNYKRVLIFFGGVDLHNLTLFTLKTLVNITDGNFQIDIVAGETNPHLSELRSEVTKHSHVKLHVQIDYMAKLMLRADICLGAGGATTWERLFLGLPSIVVTLAENQVETSTDLHNDNYIYYLGHYDQVTSDKITCALKYFEMTGSRTKFRKRIMTLVDGKGAEKIVKSVLVA